MLKSSIVRIVELCTRHAVSVIVLIVPLAAGSAVYATRHFAIETDVTDLFSPDLPWTRRVLETARVLKLADGTRTVAEIINDTGSAISPDALQWIEALFQLDLLRLLGAPPVLR